MFGYCGDQKPEKTKMSHAGGDPSLKEKLGGAMTLSDVLQPSNQSSLKAGIISSKRRCERSLV
jgi:hypothetical protein